MEVRQFLDIADALVHTFDILLFEMDLEDDDAGTTGVSLLEMDFEDGEEPNCNLLDARDDLHERVELMQRQLLDGIGDVAKTMHKADQDTDLLYRFSEYVKGLQALDKIMPVWGRLRDQLQAMCNAPSTSARDWRLAQIFSVLHTNQNRPDNYPKRIFHPFRVWECEANNEPSVDPIWTSIHGDRSHFLTLSKDDGNERMLSLTTPHPDEVARPGLLFDFQMDFDIATPLGEILQLQSIHDAIRPKSRALARPVATMFSAALDLAQDWPVSFAMPRQYQVEEQGQTLTVYEFPSVRMVAAAFILMMFGDRDAAASQQNTTTQVLLTSKGDWSIVLDSWAHAGRLLKLSDAKPERRLRRLCPIIDTTPKGNRTLRIRLDCSMLTEEQKRPLRTG